AMFLATFTLRRTIDGMPQPLIQPFSALADISYPLFVAHGILGYSIIAAMLVAGFGAWSALAVAITVAMSLAVILHVTVESPSRVLGKSLAQKQSRVK